MNNGIVYALLAAILFGVSTPFAKQLIAQTAPILLAAMLYLGSGIGLSLWLLLRRFGRGTYDNASLTGIDLPWLAGAVLAGGVVGPVLMMTGLRYIPAASASLLLNMEGVLTALLAWFVFHEQFDRRIFIGMTLIICAGFMLSWEDAVTGESLTASWGAICVIAACLCWAIDNNLTRKISASDPVQIAAVKGVTAGLVNLTFSLGWLGLPMPEISHIAVAGIIGFCGYGLSLVLFVLALRHLGTARTGAYFSAAPFVGVAVSLLVLGERPGTLFWFAAALMTIGIWMHLTELHVHLHSHDAMSHSHSHSHDAHHQHAHDFQWDGKEPHVHPHEHERLTHTHPHFPDIHHRHRHQEPVRPRAGTPEHSRNATCFCDTEGRPP